MQSAIEVRALVRQAKPGVVTYLERLSGWMEEFTRLEALQHEVQAEIGQFRAADRRDTARVE